MGSFGVAVIATSLHDEGCLRGVIPSHAATIVRADRVDVAIAQLPENTRVIVTGDPESRVAGADHVITTAWPADALCALVTAFASGRPATPRTPSPPTTVEEAASLQRALGAARRVAAATDLAQLEALATDALVECLELDRAYCLFHDAGQGSLWSEARLSEPAGDDRRAVAGLAGFAACTGVPVLAPRAGRDPRFAPTIDNPDGEASDQLIVQPVHGSDGMIEAVLVGVRAGQRQPVGPADAAWLGTFATLLPPILEQLAAQQQAQTILDDAFDEGALFRPEAVEAQLQPRWGDIVRTSPAWLPWTYRAMCALLATCIVLVVVGRVSTYSTGPAIIRSLARTPVISHTTGNIVEVDVVPGFPVTVGTVIARLDDTEQRDQIARLEREFQTRLRNRMLALGDATADTLLRDARDLLEAAREGLSDRLIRATTDGVVGDIRVHPGQHIAPGDLVATLGDAERGLEVIALLPGEDRPRLAAGMTLRLELAGYRYAYQSVAIQSVSVDVISPAEARRVLGTEVADGIAIAGPVVLVRGRLPSTEFVANGRTLAYHDGMQGVAEVRIDVESIATALVPGLRRLP